MKYHVEKSIEIDASVSTVKTFIEDFHKWNDWSPWTVLEPNCQVTVEGSAGTTGHSMSWDSEIIGSGVNTLESVDERGYHYNLVFLKPWKSEAKTSLLLEEMGAKTKVAWTMDSSMPFFMFFMVKTMKNWIGMDYDRGLRMLKEVVEKGRVSATTTNNGVVDLEGFSYVGIERTLPIEEMKKQMAKDFKQIVDDVVVKRNKGAKEWICLYPKFDMRNMVATYVAAVSDEDLKDEDLGAEYIRGKIEPGKALEIKHDGPYDFLGNAWSMGMMYMRAKKIKGGGTPFEQYWNSPLEVSPEELKTSIFFPVKN